MVPQGNASLARAYRLFRTMGLHHMFVGPAKPLVIGVITRKASSLLQCITVLTSHGPHATGCPVPRTGNVICHLFKHEYACSTVHWRAVQRRPPSSAHRVHASSPNLWLYTAWLWAARAAASAQARHSARRHLCQRLFWPRRT